MSEIETALDRAQAWCLRGTVVEGGEGDDTLSLVTADGFRQSLDVAAQAYERAADNGADRVVFAVRDRRASRARIAERLRERGVPLERAPGVAAEDDPVVDELLQVAILLAGASGDSVPATTRSHLAARVDADVDLDTLLAELDAIDDLGEALRTWVVKTELVDRLVRADDGIHHTGTPQGTVDQRASADHLGRILDVASTLDAAVTATDGYPGFGLDELVRAIEDGVMDDTPTLYRVADHTPADRPTAELCQMNALKLAAEADLVVALELTDHLIDADPTERAFAVAPALGQHPDTPGVTTVTTDRAAATFGSTDYLADGKRAWFVGLGRRHLGNAMAAASDRAVLVTQEPTNREREVTPARTVVELQDVLGIDAILATEFLSEETAATTGVETPPGTLVDQLTARLSADDSTGSETDADEPLGELAERVADAIHAGKLSEDQLRSLLETIAHYRRVETVGGES